MTAAAEHDPHAAGLAPLLECEPAFARALESGGPLRPRRWETGFPGLLRIILGQQVSTASADAMWRRLSAALDPVAPAGFLALDDDALRACGFSRPKMRYARGLAEALASGALDLDAVHAMDDAAALAALTSVKGLGRWSAEVYLLLALGRPDVWPAGDLALAIGVQWLKGLDARPTPAELDALADAWRPWRSTAARLAWHHYLAVLSRRRAGAA